MWLSSVSITSIDTALPLARRNGSSHQDERIKLMRVDREPAFFSVGLSGVALRTNVAIGCADRPCAARSRAPAAWKMFGLPLMISGVRAADQEFNLRLAD